MRNRISCLHLRHTPPQTNMEVLLSGTAQWWHLPTLMSPTETHWFLVVSYAWTPLGIVVIPLYIYTHQLCRVSLHMKRRLAKNWEGLLFGSTHSFLAGSAVRL